MSGVDQARLWQADERRIDGEDRAAIALYDALIAEFALDAEVYLAYHGRGLARQFDGDFDGSLADLERCCERQPRYRPGCRDLSKTYLMLGMNEEARAVQAWLRRLDDDGDADDALVKAS